MKGEGNGSISSFLLPSLIPFYLCGWQEGMEREDFSFSWSSPLDLGFLSFFSFLLTVETQRPREEDGRSLGLSFFLLAGMEGVRKEGQRKRRKPRDLPVSSYPFRSHPYLKTSSIERKGKEWTSHVSFSLPAVRPALSTGEGERKGKVTGISSGLPDGQGKKRSFTAIM